MLLSERVKITRETLSYWRAREREREREKIAWRNKGAKNNGIKKDQAIKVRCKLNCVCRVVSQSLSELTCVCHLKYIL